MRHCLYVDLREVRVVVEAQHEGEMHVVECLTMRDDPNDTSHSFTHRERHL